jgi:hypothetical protein
LNAIPPSHDSINDAAEHVNRIKLSRSDMEIERLKRGLADLQNKVDSKKKDGWDIAGIVAQVFSGSIIAGLGIAVAIYAHSRDLGERNAEFKITKTHDDAEFALSSQQNKDQIALAKARDKAESDLESRKNFMDFLDRFSKAGTQEQTELLEQMEMILTPAQAIRIAMANIHPAYALEDKDQLERDSSRFNQVISFAEHLKVEGEVADFLREVSQSNVIPDSEIARAILGEKTGVFIRASEIDDFGDITLNGRPLLRQLTFGEDSGWVPITDKLKINAATSDVNELKFLVTNSPFGGFGGRFQISAGLQQYDSGPYANPNCPCNKPAFMIVAKLRMPLDRKVQLVKVPEFARFDP